MLNDVVDARAISIRDVTLRDGLQLVGGTISPERRAGLARQLLALGFPAVEIGSMARSDLIPAMAGTLEAVAMMTPEELERCWVWVATPSHVARAAEVGAKNFQYCLSASESHSQANLGRSTDRSLSDMSEATHLVAARGGQIQLCIATAFTCPFEGTVPEQRVIDIANDPRTDGAEAIVLCDTLGQAIPEQVRSLLTRVVKETPDRRMVFHGHDTWGLGVANSLAAIAAGAVEVDGALGGLGGCPFAPGASGNTATEDLLFALRPSWFNPDVLTSLVRLSSSLLDDLGEENRSRAVDGALHSPATYRWAVPAANEDGSIPPQSRAAHA